MASLKEVGAQGAVAQMVNEIRKEKRRARASSREDQDVLLALARQRDQEMALERKRRLMLQEDKKRALTAAKLNEEAKAAKARLKKRKREIEDAEAVLEAKHAIKQYSLEDLGKGRSRGGGVAAKKRRWEVLDRLARLGQGLSPAQRNDFAWFKEAWDARMLQEHRGKWPETFTGWMQRLLGDNENGTANAFPFSFITKRVDVSMGCLPCESHELVMAAVAAMRLGPSLGQWGAHQSVLWARAARQGDPTTRPTFSQSHACYDNYMEAMACSCGVQLMAAVAACSWPQSRHGMQLRVLTRAE